MTDQPTVLVTGIGSLVGQVILDSLEGRRAGLFLVGCNMAADSPNNFRCDRVHLVPATESPEFGAAVLQLCELERPALLIPGRDPDIVLLSKLAEGRPDLRTVLLAGSARMAEMMADKAETARFSQRHGLPFAESVETDAPDAVAAAQALLERHGLPLIAKPCSGSGSLGVRVIMNEAHLDAALSCPGLLLQPFLDPPPALEPPAGPGTPLFWGIEEDRLHAVQILIGRDGSVGPSFGFRARMISGRCERLERIDNPDLLAVANDFADVVAAEGWRGPFNVQAKRDREGAWNVIELNGRFSGGTSARRHVGFDEVALVVNGWLGKPVVPLQRSSSARVVVRQFADRPLDAEALAALARQGQWSSS